MTLRHGWDKVAMGAWVVEKLQRNGLARLRQLRLISG